MGMGKKSGANRKRRIDNPNFEEIKTGLRNNFQAGLFYISTLEVRF